MLLVSYLYNISERQTEEVANLSHRDKKRISENGKLMAYERLLKEMAKIALEKGTQLGSIQVPGPGYQDRRAYLRSFLDNYPMSHRMKKVWSNAWAKLRL